jgi:predicted acylesterase/phospholipase RssA
MAAHERTVAIACQGGGSHTAFTAAVNVLSGRFKVFRNPRVTVEAILASAAIPNLFRAACVRNLP